MDDQYFITGKNFIAKPINSVFFTPSTKLRISGTFDFSNHWMLHQLITPSNINKIKSDTITAPAMCHQKSDVAIFNLLPFVFHPDYCNDSSYNSYNIYN